jgi:cold shock CspA family protein
MAAPRTERLTGTIKNIVTTKGFGFIVLDHSAEEYFFHFSGCTVKFDSLRKGQRVVFTPTETPKGPRAEQVGPV